MPVIVHVDPQFDAAGAAVILPHHIGEAVAYQRGGQLHPRCPATHDEGEVDRCRVEHDATAIGVGRQVDLVAAGDARTLEVEDGVDGRGRTVRSGRVVSEGENVVARAAAQRVAVKAADDLVTPRAAVQHVLAEAADDDVRRAAAGDDVVARAAGDLHAVDGGRAVEVEKVGLQLPAGVDPGDVGLRVKRQLDLSRSDRETLDIADGIGIEQDIIVVDAVDGENVDAAGQIAAAVDPVQRVQIGADIDIVRAVAAHDRVVAGSGDDLVIAVAAVQQIIAIAAIEKVVAAVAVDGVVAAKARKRVIPARAGDCVRAARAGIDIVFGIAGIVRHRPSPHHH